MTTPDFPADMVERVEAAVYDPTTFQPDWVSPPGDTISEILAHRTLSLEAFAARIGTPIDTANELTRGMARIDDGMAKRLERALGPSAAFWINREAQYRADVERLSSAATEAAGRAWVRQLPLRDMVDDTANDLDPPADVDEIAARIIARAAITALIPADKRAAVLAVLGGSAVAVPVEATGSMVVEWERGFALSKAADQFNADKDAYAAMLAASPYAQEPTP